MVRRRCAKYGLWLSFLNLACGSCASLAYFRRHHLGQPNCCRWKPTTYLYQRRWQCNRQGTQVRLSGSKYIHDAIIQVDNSTTVPYNDKRNSVRLTSNDKVSLPPAAASQETPLTITKARPWYCNSIRRPPRAISVVLYGHLSGPRQ